MKPKFRVELKLLAINRQMDQIKKRCKMYVLLLAFTNLLTQKMVGMNQKMQSNESEISKIEALSWQELSAVMD